MLKSSKDTHRRTQFFVAEWGRRIEVATPALHESVEPN